MGCCILGADSHCVVHESTREYLLKDSVFYVPQSVYIENISNTTVTKVDVSINDVEAKSTNGRLVAGREEKKQVEGAEQEDDRIRTIPEYTMLPLADIRKIVQCPICLGITRKTKAVKDFFHRFCGECIEKAIRVGKKECPACRTSCPSRRSLKEDPNNDALIASMFGDIDKYEAEEMAEDEEEMACAKQIQASIAETSKRQTDAACRKRSAKAVGPVAKRSQNHPEDGNGGRGSSSSAAAWEDDTEATKVSKSVPAVFAASNRLSWGKGGIRSPPRHTRNGFKAKLVVELEIAVDTDPKMIILVPLNEQGIPNLKEPYICCRPTLSAEQLCLYVSLKTGVCKDEIELSIVTELHSKVDDATPSSSQSSDFIKLDASKDKLRVLQAQETIESLSMYTCYKGNMVIGYQKKSQSS